MRPAALCATWLVSLATALLPFRPAAAAEDAAPAADGALAAVAPLVGGEWVLEGKWANGEPIKARETFEWGLGNKFVTSRTFLSRNDGSGEYERYRGVFAVKDGKLVSYNFAYDGENTVEEAKVRGNVITLRRETTTPAPMAVRQEIELTEKDKFRWRVWIERDGKSEQIIDGEWVRRAAEAPAK